MVALEVIVYVRLHLVEEGPHVKDENLVSSVLHGIVELLTRARLDL